MSSATPWTNATPASVNRKNKTSVISLPGNDLALLDKTKFAIVVCTEDGDIFLKDHVYLFGINGSDVIDISDIQRHTHTSNTTGGHIKYLYAFSPSTIDQHFFHPTSLLKENWMQTVTGTGSIEDGGGGTTEPYIRLRPNGTSGSGSTISYSPGKPKLNLGSLFNLVSVINFETASSLAAHIGINADDVTAADSNTAKVQAEVCTSTSNNWYIRTANGSANSASDMGVSAMTTSNQAIILGHDPDAGTPNSMIHVSGTTFTKTTNINTADTNNATGHMIKFSVKNNTAADRPMRYRGCRVTFGTQDTWGYGDLPFEF